MQDRPTAPELLKAAQEFCENDLMPALTGRVRFHARVLLNVLRILEREWEGEEAAVRAEWERLRDLFGSDDPTPDGFAALGSAVRDWNTELARRIREGAFDDRFDETIAALRATVTDKLAIANPKYAPQDGTADGAD
jgi:hypothetical protein